MLQRLWGYSVFILSVFPSIVPSVCPSSVRPSVRPSVTFWLFLNILSTLMSIRCSFEIETMGMGPILLELLPFVILNGVRSCMCKEFNSYHSFHWYDLIRSVQTVDPLDICMKKSDVIKILFDKMTTFWTVFNTLLLNKGFVSAHIVHAWGNLVAELLQKHLIPCINNVDILNICMKKCDAINILFDKMTAFWT